MRTLWLGLVCSACSVRPAPEDLDTLLRTLWADAGTASDAQLSVDLSAVPQVVDMEQARSRQGIRGNQGPLQSLDIEEFDFFTPDGEPTRPPIEDAVGIHLISQAPCTESALLDILLYPDQMELYGSYESYSRTYDDDPNAFRSGQFDRMRWRGQIETFIPFPVGATYLYDFRTELRRVDTADGTVYVTRTWMPAPATWDREGPSFEQDYQLEVWIPDASGEQMLQLYPVWRQMRAGGFEMSNEGMQFITLDQMAKWGRRTAELCEQGLHPYEG